MEEIKMDNKEAIAPSVSNELLGGGVLDNAERESFDLCDDCEDIVCMCGDKPPGYDDSNCCDECGGDLDVYETCNSCDV